MPRNPNPRDDADIIRRLDEEVRQLRLRKRGHTETKTYVVGGSISSALYIPGFYVGLDSDGNTPEGKFLIGFAGHLATGTNTGDWYLNGTPVYTGHAIDATPPNRVDLAVPVAVADLDVIRFIVTDGTGENLSAGAIFATAAR